MHKKKKGQIFTPTAAVHKLIEFAGLKSVDLFGKRILDCACGSGNILKPLVLQYINNGRQRGFTDSEIRTALESNIVGLDIDQECCELCFLRLSEIAENAGLEEVEWRILNVDALKCLFFEDAFDVVIANPPYVNYHDLDEKTRSYIRDHYAVCKKGRFDYYYAFFEFGINCLSESGMLCYLVPNSIYKNVFASELRRMIKPFLTAIGDFKTEKVFDALTSSTFIRLEKPSSCENVYYHDFDKDTGFCIKKELLAEHDKWLFTASDIVQDEKAYVFEEKFHASCPVATLRNEVFLIHPNLIHEWSSSEILLRDGSKIERDLIRFAISPKSARQKKDMLIVFPYEEGEQGLKRLTEDKLKTFYPEGFKYLCEHRKALNERSSDAGQQWYEYGRSQGLTRLREQRLLISTVVTNKVHVIEVDSGVVPYAGIVISSRSGHSLSEAKKVLEGEEFLEYVHLVGSNVSGSSVRITSKDVNHFLCKG